MKQFTFFYTNKTITTESTTGNFASKHFEVIKVDSSICTMDEANRKARTIATGLNKELSGGYFVGSYLPYNFDANYTVIECPNDTAIQPYTEKDLFIHALIEHENKLQFSIL